MQNKALGLLSLCRKAGKLALGEDLVADAVHAGRARLLILASDTAAGTCERIRRLSRDGNPPLVQPDLPRAVLGEAVGRAACAAAAITDAGLARAFAAALPEPDEAVLQELDRRVRRQQKKHNK